MDLTLTVEDLASVTFLDSRGTEYRVVPTTYLESVEDEIGQLMAKFKRKKFSQTEIKKIYGVGNTTIKNWVAGGVKEIPDGSRILYDIDEIDEYLNTLKI